MQIVVVEQNSRWMDSIIALGDLSRDTVGFLPRQAFYEYADKGNIMAAIEGDSLIGYILFRWRETAIIIVQLCVDHACRKNGVAKALVDELCTRNEEYYAFLRLSCRRDYGLEAFWRSLGFLPISERPGRATKSSTLLTTWIKNNPCQVDLFSLASEQNVPRRKIALDTNIIIDLCEDMDPESSQLMQPFILDNVDYYITTDAISEINKNEDAKKRNFHREYAIDHFSVIEVIDGRIYESARDDLLQKKKKSKHSNTGIDISHIAYAIAFDAQVFVTRDSEWLNTGIADYVFENYGLLIQSPGEFIKSVDEMCSPDAYSPIGLVGLDLEYAEMQAERFSEIVNCLYRYYSPNRKSAFERALRLWLAEPNKYHVLLLSSATKPVSLIVYANVEVKTQEVVCLLLNGNAIRPALYTTLVKRIVFKLLEDAKRLGMSCIRVNKGCLTESCINALKESLFFECGDYFQRSICTRRVSLPELEKMVKASKIDVLKRIFGIYQQGRKDGNARVKAAIEIEKALWPLKIKDETIPCYIVPIKADYAKALFDEELANTNISLFSNEQIEPALSIENAYYKNARKRVSRYPARILWYVSRDKRLFGSGMIRACSYLDGVEVGNAKKLFQKYRRLGVLKWNDIRNIDQSTDEICVYKFSYTEQFGNPVPYQAVKKALGKHVTFQSFVEVSYQEFENLYEFGIGVSSDE